MICKRCNTLNSNDATNCENCGAELKPKTSSVAAPQNAKKSSGKINLALKKTATANLKSNSFTYTSKYVVVGVSFLIILFFIVLGLDLIGGEFNLVTDLVNRINSTSQVTKNQEKRMPVSLAAIWAPEEFVIVPKPKKQKDGSKVVIKRKPRNLQTYTNPKDKMTMILIPAGEVKVGSNSDRNSNPAHKVRVMPFYIDEHEVTNKQYLKFVKETNRALPKYMEDKKNVDLEKPVVGVSLADAMAYAKWAGKRLPSEFEWEIAARGGFSNLNYPFSNKLLNINFVRNRNSSGRAAKVARTEKNDFGLYDLSGNVFEWTISDAKAYPGGDIARLEGYKVVKGGSFLSSDEDLKVYKRFFRKKNYVARDLGFRCVMDN